MIYLIGGPPKCGKTTFAKRLSKSAGIAWVSTDTLQNVIKPYITDADMRTKFPLSMMKYANNDKKYSAHTTTEIIMAYKQQAVTSQSAIKAFVAAELTDGNDYAVEGYHVTPDLIAMLTKEHPKKVRGLILVKKDPAAFLADMRRSTTPNDWILSKTHDDATFPKIAAMVIEYSIELEKVASDNGIKVYCVDEDFDKRLEEAASYMTGTNNQA
jgi:2-phosphoglycerate kinase